VVDSTPLIAHYRAAPLRLLAQPMERRSPGLPHVPTFRAVVRLLVGFEKTLPDDWDRWGPCRSRH
jgi:hypothetical protein